jgi:hypothetical protein
MKMNNGLELLQLSQSNLSEAMKKEDVGSIAYSLAILAMATTRSMMDLNGITGRIEDHDQNFGR